MATENETNVQQMSLEELTQLVHKLKEELDTFKNKGNNKSQREMTDNDARSVLAGEHAQLSHNKAAEALKLSYGQIYSCRLKYTFRHIHAELEKNPNYKNQWIKK